MKRILLKLSGEALAGEKHIGFDEATVTVVAKQVMQLAEARKSESSLAAAISGAEEPVRRLTVQRQIRSECLQL